MRYNKHTKDFTVLFMRPSQALWDVQPAGPRVSLWLWFVLVLGSWTLLHAVTRTLFDIEAASPSVRFTWWTLWKVITWLGPTFILLRRAGVASASWLGLSTARGLGAALLWSTAWLAFQKVCEMQGLSLVARNAPPEHFSMVAGALLVAPLFEEIMFRGALLRLLRARGYGRERAVWVSALAFTVLHLPGWISRFGFDATIPSRFGGIMLFGVGVGYLAWRVPSLWGPIALHFLNNAWATRALDMLMSVHACETQL